MSLITVAELRELSFSADVAARSLSVLSAASGLIQVGSKAYVVADDELHLGVFPLDGPGPGHLIRVFDGILPDDRLERKRQKPDLEALALLPPFQDFPHGGLLALGSGSRPNRGRGALLKLDKHGSVHEPVQALDMSPLLAPLRPVFSELNIEGAVVVGDEFFLFQRGNRRHPENAIMRYPLSQILTALRDPPADVIEPSGIHRLDLGSIDGVPFCFTDASALPDGEVAFCAVAEDTDDAYRDGPCLGGAIGIIGVDGCLLSLQRLDRPYKVEGISARPVAGGLAFLLVTDADDPAVPAMLLSASMTR
jgi:hypothetical protein